VVSRRGDAAEEVAMADQYDMKRAIKKIRALIIALGQA
jgi:hypothetical protein